MKTEQYEDEISKMRDKAKEKEGEISYLSETLREKEKSSREIKDELNTTMNKTDQEVTNLKNKLKVQLESMDMKDDVISK